MNSYCFPCPLEDSLNQIKPWGNEEPFSNNCQEESCYLTFLSVIDSPGFSKCQNPPPRESERWMVGLACGGKKVVLKRRCLPGKAALRLCPISLWRWQLCTHHPCPPERAVVFVEVKPKREWSRTDCKWPLGCCLHVTWASQSKPEWSPVRV